MKNTICIFCKRALDNSDEHIIPQSLNGRLHSRFIICHDCNSNFFGRKIDPIVKQTFNPLLLALGWDNANSIKGEDIQGNDYLIKKGMKSQPMRPTRMETDIERGKLISISGKPKDVIGLLKKEILRQKENGKIITEYEAREVKNHSPFIRAKWVINQTTELNLFLNKIALEYHSFCGLPYTDIENLCFKVRAYSSNLNNVKLCNYRNEVREFNGNEVSHLIVLQSDSDSNKLYAYIEIFNILCCVVVLSDNYHGLEISSAYYQDATTGQRITDPITIKMSIKDILEHEFVHDNFQYLNNSLVDRLRSKEFDEVFQEQLELIMEELKEQQKKGKINDEDFEDTYVKRSAEMLAELTVHHFPYILEDQDDELNDEYNYIHSNFRTEIVDKFCEEHNHLIGKKLIMKDGIYEIKEFYKKPIIVKKDKELIKVYAKLEETSSGQAEYIETTELIKTILKALRILQSKHENRTNSQGENG